MFSGGRKPDVQHCAVAFACLLLTACVTTQPAPPETEAERAGRLVRMEASARKAKLELVRVRRVFRPLAIAAAEICGNFATFQPGYRTAVLMPDGDSVANEVLRRVDGATERGPVVSAVDEGGPAANAGLQAGDVVLAIGGVPVPPTGPAALAALRRASPGSAAPLATRVLRDGREIELAIAAERACDMPVDVSDEPRVHASVGGRQGIVVTAGMLQFASDDDLAVVLGHELSHILLDMRSRPERDALLGGAARSSATGTGRAEIELDCDHLGVLLAARAGFDVGGSAELWRRSAGGELSETRPKGGQYPSHAERYAALKEVVDQVGARRAAGQPVLPGFPDLLLRPVPQPAHLPGLDEPADPATGTAPTPASLRPNPGAAPVLAPAPPAVGQAGAAFRDCADCPEMIPLPAGAFDMGDLDGSGYAHERPVRRITLARPFAVGKYEVTQAEWRAVMGGNPSRFAGDARPVENVTWIEAKEYARRLAATTGKPYRLLSEAEWEYAARAGSCAAYPWGDAISPLQARYAGGDGTELVGSYPPNAFGLHDTAGNVWEWVEDCWSRSLADIPADGAAQNPVGCDARVSRGGSWGRRGGALRSAYREWAAPGVRSPTIGFRVARGM